MYLGDEQMLYPMDHAVFESLAWVYHQMWRADLRYGKQDYSYLLRPLPTPGPGRPLPTPGPGNLLEEERGGAGGRGGVPKGLYWIPVGPAHTWRPFEILDNDISNRTHLFSFMGKVDSR